MQVWLRARSLLRVQAEVSTLLAVGRWQGGRKWSLMAGIAARRHTILSSPVGTEDTFLKITPLH